MTRQFIDHQMEAMRNGTAEVAAYAATRNWLVGKGPRLFAQLDVPAQIRNVLAQHPQSLLRLRAQEDESIERQFKRTQEMLAAVRRAEGGRGEGGQAATAAAGAAAAAAAAASAGSSGASSQAKLALARRALSNDPQLPRRPASAQ